MRIYLVSYAGTMQKAAEISDGYARPDQRVFKFLNGGREVKESELDQSDIGVPVVSFMGTSEYIWERPTDFSRAGDQMWEDPYPMLKDVVTSYIPSVDVGYWFSYSAEKAQNAAGDFLSFVGEYSPQFGTYKDNIYNTASAFNQYTQEVLRPFQQSMSDKSVHYDLDGDINFFDPTDYQDLAQREVTRLASLDVNKRLEALDLLGQQIQLDPRPISQIYPSVRKQGPVDNQMVYVAGGAMVLLILLLSK